ncbi:MAG: hypothetical protein ACE5JK_02525 [Candidatus Omnitrophota bacterium]
MFKGKEKFTSRSGFFVIVGVLLFVYLFKGLDAFYHSKLSAPSIFQRSSPDQSTEGFKKSALSDLRFLTTAFSVAAHFLVDGRGKETLARTMRDEFRNNKEFIKGVDFESVWSDGDAVVMPFQRNGRTYEAKIFVRKPDGPEGEPLVWGESEKFGIEISPAIRRTSTKALEKKHSGDYDDIRRTMKAIHEKNLELIPPIEAGKILWHVIPAKLIPYSIRSEFVAFINEMNQKYPDSREKIKIVTERQDFFATVKDLAGDSANLIDAAVATKDDLRDLPKSVKALVFEGALGDFRQLEGIIAALRALQQEDVEALTDLYMLMTGEEFQGDLHEVAGSIEDPSLLAEFLTFSLSPVKVHNVRELDRLNKEQVRFIHAA